MKDHEKIQTTVRIFFEIRDSAMYGGIGSVGYAESSMEGEGSGKFEGYVSEQKKAFANLMKVPEEYVKVITKEEYEENTVGDEDLQPIASMTLEEAIRHCEEKADDSSCGREHGQLAQWLRELSWFRKAARRPFYFTFGSSEKFPYQNGFLIVYAGSYREAVEKFKVLYPNPQDEGVLNCSDYYDEVKWKEILEEGFYKGMEPFEIIR